MTRRNGQDELTRRRRLMDGCCPTHGIGLAQTGLVWKNGEPIGEEVSCPRGDCDFQNVPAIPGDTKHGALYRAIHPERNGR